MKLPFSTLVLHAILRRKKDVYYAVSIISMAGNLIFLVGPTVQASVLSLSRMLQTIGSLQTAASSYIGSLQTAFQAVSAVGALQIRSWNTTIPQVVQLVFQRSILCILLNLIVARIVFKSGVLGGQKSSTTPFCSKQEEFHSFSSLLVCGSHWLAPSYLHTVCSTMSNFSDAPITGPSMLLQQAHHYHSRTVAITDTSMPAIPISKNLCMHYFHHDSQPTEAKESTHTAGTNTVDPAPTPTTPSLFTIEPLDEVVQSMKPQQLPYSESQVVSRHPLRKVETKVDLLQQVQSHRRRELKPKCNELRHRQKTAQRIKGKHAILRKEHHDMIWTIKNGNVRHDYDWTEFDHVRKDAVVDDDDNQLSRQQFKKRVDTFIYEVKRNLNMQRQDSLSRLLGFY